MSVFAWIGCSILWIGTVIGWAIKQLFFPEPKILWCVEKEVSDKRTIAALDEQEKLDETLPPSGNCSCCCGSLTCAPYNVEISSVAPGQCSLPEKEQQPGEHHVWNPDTQAYELDISFPFGANVPVENESDATEIIVDDGEHSLILPYKSPETYPRIYHPDRP